MALSSSLPKFLIRISIEKMIKIKVMDVDACNVYLMFKENLKKSKKSLNKFKILIFTINIKYRLSHLVFGKNPLKSQGWAWG